MDQYPATDEISAATAAAVESFNAAFNRQDADTALATMTDDCVFEITYPAPDGQRFEGQAAVRGAFKEFFAAAPTARFDTEEAFAAGDRAVVRWRFTWQTEGGEGHVRGVDIFRVSDGKVAEKLSYVKG